MAHTEADGRIWLPQRDEIGAMLNLTFETASRLISQFKREGLIELPDLRHARIDGPALQHALRVEDER